MPVEVVGLKALQDKLRLFEPDLKREMDREIRAAMLPIRDAARGFVMNPTPRGLFNWAVPAQKTGTYRSFPEYNSEEIQRGIVYSAGKNKKNSNGYSAVYYIANKSAAGAIYETAGRKSGAAGQPWEAGKSGDHDYSHSNNPNAGAHMISRLGPLYGNGKQRGRLIFRAWEQDQGKVYAAVLQAIESAASRFNAGRFGMSKAA